MITRLLSRLIAIFSFVIVLFLSHQALSNPFPNQVFDELDFGFYFFGEGNAHQKFQEGFQNPYFDPAKKTLIYVHGWQNNTTRRRFRETFESNGIDGAPQNIDLAKAWLEQDFNLAIFYWNQFADEGEVKNAEAKIWTAAGPKGMRWRKSNSSYSTEGSGDKSIAKLFADEYARVFQGHQGAEIRMVGHSLGAQAVIVGAAELRSRYYNGELPYAALPDRVTLLDAAFLNGARNYLNGDWTGERARTMVDNLKRENILIEAYRSSGATSNPIIGDSNYGLLKKTAFAEIRPWYFNIFQFPKKHQVARWWYLQSIQYPAPRLENSSNPGISAATTADWLRYWMDSYYRVDQTEGRRTKRLSDDEFTVKRK